MSFSLKTLDNLLDRHIRDGVSAEKPLHQNQYAYKAGISTETALFQVVQILKVISVVRRLWWVPCLILKGHMTTPPLMPLLQ
jgi:hypothetical protein